MNKEYRLGVGIVILNKENKIFAGKRISASIDVWQMPQGGIDPNETPIQAIYREMLEETGSNNIELIQESKDWLYYDIPNEILPKSWHGKYCGQKQKWFLAKFLGEDLEFNLNTEHPEFIEWNWTTPLELLNDIVDFKRKLYEDIFEEFGL